MIDGSPSRRDVLRAGAGLALLAPFATVATVARAGAAASGACLLTPELTEGPFYLAGERVRRDITEGRAGIPLALDFRVLDAATCAPLAGVAIDVWQCDALGVYSGFATASLGPPPGAGPGGPPPGAGRGGGPQVAGGFGPPAFGGGPPPHGGPHGGPPPMRPTDRLTYLRGIQLADALGRARFASIFPGYYAGRTNHVHLKVHLPQTAAERALGTGRVVHTGQVFFPEALARALSARPAYAEHRVARVTLEDDGVYRSASGNRAASIAEVRRIDVPGEAYAASVVLLVDRNATPRPRA